MQYMRRKWLQGKLSRGTLQESLLLRSVFCTACIHHIFSYVLGLNQWGRGGNRALHWNSESPLVLISSQQTGIHSKTFFWYWRDDKVKCSGEDHTFLYGLQVGLSWSWGLFPVIRGNQFLNQRSAFSTRHAFASNAAPRGSDVSGIKSNTLNRRELQSQ